MITEQHPFHSALRSSQVEQGLSDGLLVMLQHAAAPSATPSTPAAAAAAKTPKKAGKKGAAAAPETPAGEAGAAPPPSVWLPELASQVALQVRNCFALLLILFVHDMCIPEDQDR